MHVVDIQMGWTELTAQWKNVHVMVMNRQLSNKNVGLKLRKIGIYSKLRTRVNKAFINPRLIRRPTKLGDQSLIINRLGFPMGISGYTLPSRKCLHNEQENHNLYTMGKSTISKWPFSMAICVVQEGISNVHPIIILKVSHHHPMIIPINHYSHY